MSATDIRIGRLACWWKSWLEIEFTLLLQCFGQEKVGNFAILEDIFSDSLQF